MNRTEVELMIMIFKIVRKSWLIIFEDLDLFLKNTLNFSLH